MTGWREDVQVLLATVQTLMGSRHFPFASSHMTQAPFSNGKSLSHDPIPPFIFS